MKGKNTQPRILYPERLLLSFDREIKSFTDKKKLRAQHTQIIFTTNRKGTFLDRKVKAITENEKIANGKVHCCKGNQAVKLGNQSHTNIKTSNGE